MKDKVKNYIYPMILAGTITSCANVKSDVNKNQDILSIPPTILQDGKHFQNQNSKIQEGVRDNSEFILASGSTGNIEKKDNTLPIVASENGVNANFGDSEKSLKLSITNLNDAPALGVEYKKVGDKLSYLITTEIGGDKKYLVASLKNKFGEDITAQLTAGKTWIDYKGKTVGQMFFGAEMKAKITEDILFGAYASHSKSDDVMLSVVEVSKQKADGIYKTKTTTYFDGAKDIRGGLSFDWVYNPTTKISGFLGYSSYDSKLDLGGSLENLWNDNKIKTKVSLTNQNKSFGVSSKLDKNWEIGAEVSRYDDKTRGMLNVTYNFDGTSKRYSNFTAGNISKDIQHISGTMDAMNSLKGEEKTIITNEFIPTTINEAPTDIILNYVQGLNLTTNTPANTEIATLSCVDDGGNNCIYGTGTDGFKIVGNKVILTKTLTKGNHNLSIISTDQGGKSYSETFVVSVGEGITDTETVNKKPTISNLTYNSVKVSGNITDSDGVRNTRFVLYKNGVKITENTTGNFTGLTEKTDYEVQEVSETYNPVSKIYTEVQSPKTPFTTTEKPVDYTISDISLSNNSIKENLPADSLVGTLSCTTNGICDYKITNSVPFTIKNKNEIYTTEVLDFETTSSYNLQIKATNKADSSKTFTKTITINVENELGANISNVDVNVSGDSITLTATATNADSYIFKINGTEVKNSTSPTYTDSGLANGNYTYEVEAINGEGNDAKSGNFEVNEAPSWLSILNITEGDDGGKDFTRDFSVYVANASGGIFSATNLPTGLTIDPTTGVVTGYFDADPSEAHRDGNSNVFSNIVITYTKGTNTYNSNPFTWDIEDDG